MKNTSFSRKLPNLQLYVDSTSLGEFKICPRRYYYSIVIGLQMHVESVHLTFGLLLHGAIERYHHLTVGRESDRHERALLYIIKWVMTATWDKNLNRPWQSDHKTKNRFTLVRTIVWYLDRFKDDPIETIVLASGEPAVELPFQFDSGYASKYTGESFTVCGHMDRLGKLNEVSYVVDIKSTYHTLSQEWFDKFTPDNQFTIYVTAGEIVFNVQTAGLIVDGCRVTVTESQFQRSLVSRTPFQLKEWHEDLGYHLSKLDDCARTGKYPQNDSVCNLYGGCQFRPLCSAKSESSRQKFLSLLYKPRTWDPLQRRGDI